MKNVDERITFFNSYPSSKIDEYLVCCLPVEKKATKSLMCKPSALTISDVNEIFCDVCWSGEKNLDTNATADTCKWYACKGESEDNIELWEGLVGLPINFI